MFRDLADAGLVLGALVRAPGGKFIAHDLRPRRQICRQHLRRPASPKKGPATEAIRQARERDIAVPRDALRDRRHQEDERDEGDPDDRDDVDPLVVTPEAPGSLLERVACLEAQDDREDERDVEADHRNRRADLVADVRVPERRHHQEECKRGDHPDREHRHAVALRHPAPELMPGHGPVAREGEVHPRGRRH